MEIKGKVHCFFEQSGTFKNEFKKLGYDAYDYDIQNNFGQTDHVIDLFSEIEKAYIGGGITIFDSMSCDDLIMAFYPCIYFTEKSQLAMSFDYINYRCLDTEAKIENILERNEQRNKFYVLLIKLFGVVMRKRLRLILENPNATIHYLRNNFLLKPKLIDNDRTLRGDVFKKPTQYWFVNCEPTNGCTFQQPKEHKDIEHSKASGKAGLCSEERSMISPDYARNFIHDFILGKEQQNSQLTLF